jgi:hypothetical protein
LAISLFNGDVRIYCDAGINKGRLKSYAGDQALLAISKYYTWIVEFRPNALYNITKWLKSVTVE